MAIIGLQKGSGKRSRVREKSVKSQGILLRIMSGNPAVCQDVSWIMVKVKLSGEVGHM